MCRTLWYRKRDCTFECETCGEAHANPDGQEYHSVEFASERLTATGWERVPEESVFWVDEDFQIHFEPMNISFGDDWLLPIGLTAYCR